MSVQFSSTQADTRKHTHTHTDILFFTKELNRPHTTRPYLFPYLSAVWSHPSSTPLYRINGIFESDGMQIFVMEGQLMKHEAKLVNGQLVEKGPS